MRNLGLALTPLSVLALAACSPSTSGLGDTGGDDIADTAGTESGSESTSESGTTTTTTTTETGDGDTSTTTTTTTTETGTESTTTTTTETGTESTTTTTETGMDTTTTTTTTTGDGDTTTTTDTGGLEPCADGELGVEIDLTSANLPANDCADLNFEGWVTQINANEFVIDDCACNDQGCQDPEIYTLTLIEPAAGWLPEVAVDQCYEWDFYHQVITPNVCRYNRLDVLDSSVTNKPIYSTGVASEDFNKNGLEIGNANPVECIDDCGTWQLRDVTFKVSGNTVTVPYGTMGAMDNSPNDVFDLMAWHSWTVDPPACAVEDDVTAWALIRTGP